MIALTMAAVLILTSFVSIVTHDRYSYVRTGNEGILVASLLIAAAMVAERVLA